MDRSRSITSRTAICSNSILFRYYPHFHRCETVLRIELEHITVRDVIDLDRSITAFTPIRVHAINAEYLARLVEAIRPLTEHVLEDMVNRFQIHVSPGMLSRDKG